MRITTRESRNESMRDGATRVVETVQGLQALQQTIQDSGETPVFESRTTPLPDSEGGLRYGEHYGEHKYGAG